MKIISSFKDYYDFAYINPEKGDHREAVYIRKPELKIAYAAFEFFDRNYFGSRWGNTIKSKWWDKNKIAFELSVMPKSLRSACLFVCGKAYPFLFLRDKVKIGAGGKGGQIKLSTIFNQVIKNSIVKDNRKQRWNQDLPDEETLNFFKTYYSIDEFFDDITIDKGLPSRWVWTDKFIRQKIKRFFDFYESEDFTGLHILLDSPLLLTLFEHKECAMGISKKEYEFIIDPNLYEFDFMRVLPGDIMLQELEMFLGSVLVKDVMPPSYQSDLDKITAHGFDTKTSFRKIK